MSGRADSTGLEQGQIDQEEDGNSVLMDSKQVLMETKCEEAIKSDGDLERGPSSEEEIIRIHKGLKTKTCSGGALLPSLAYECGRKRL